MDKKSKKAASQAAVHHILSVAFTSLRVMLRIWPSLTSSAAAKAEKTLAALAARFGIDSMLIAIKNAGFCLFRGSNLPKTRDMGDSTINDMSGEWPPMVTLRAAGSDTPGRPFGFPILADRGGCSLERKVVLPLLLQTPSLLDFECEVDA